MEKCRFTESVISRPDQSLALNDISNFSSSGGLRLSVSQGDIAQKKIVISIITVVYNGGSHLEKTIKSVLNQVCDGIEYIIIDGGSTDETLSIIKRYEHAIDLWVSERDNGIYDAMNKGLSLASGDWINFMNCGDAFVSVDSVSKILCYLKANRDCIISGNVRIVDRDGNYLNKKHPYSGTSHSELLKYNCVAHQAAFVSKSVFNSMGGFESKYKIHGDYEFWIRAMISDIKFVYVNVDVADFCNDGISSNRDLVPIAIRERYLILKTHKVITSLEAYFYEKLSIFYYRVKTVIRRVLNIN